MPSSNWIAPNEASLLKVNLTSRTYTKDKLPAALSAVESPKIAWSAAGKKMFYLGGKDLVNGGFGFFAYTFNAKDGWKDISKVMKAPAYGGTKIIAFAGYGDVTTLSDIYILDVATTTWTKGANAPASEARTSTACGVSGDYFVSWSGSSDGSDFGDKFPSTVIYNIKTNQWTDSFVGSGNAPKATTQRPTSSSVPSSETPLSNKTSSNSPSVSVILLPILGIVILGLGVGIFIRYRSHRSPVEEKKNNAHYEEQTEDHSRGRNPHHSQIDSPATLSTSIVYDGSGASGERVQRNPHYSPQHPTYVAQEYNYHSSVPAYYQDSPISYPSHTLENWPQRGAFVAGRPMEEEKVSQHPHALVMDQESADYVPYSCAVPDKTSSDGDDSYVRPNMVYTGQFQDPSVNKS
ncbi:hypothetical protein BGX31_004401 [Mortierella sp. GBA43]|nr:hypothetical protein BGX31_004401 [Mortierella sp. GBA43]